MLGREFWSWDLSSDHHFVIVIEIVIEIESVIVMLMLILVDVQQQMYEFDEFQLIRISLERQQDHYT